MDIMFATKNAHKLEEIRAIMADTPFRIRSLLDFDSVDIEEDCDSFEGNARKKAVETARLTKMLTLADDSGLEIDALDKLPGIFSARFLGENTSYDIKNAFLLNLLEGIPFEKRTARFVCAIAACFPISGGSDVICVSATLEGYIHDEIRGGNGFGYDPIFFVPEFQITSAQLPPEIKNAISHRGKALALMKTKLIQTYLKENAHGRV